ncbi:hypothetical protein [Spongiactinospora sp. TRM90649]|uniref:RNA polymerase sigma factor n=1 Tax=Spongiactinospora sp. TRM90649 TaxID=3031114 RepID=UPI0023F62287|nr:hypothetical protein [Spongiactinospora sp. TRM90649]MDF5756404.1 hypothetical protein [Spongiactinospora sp. TRM90649]
MTHPLTDRRSHSELVAELYDRHAVGLFAYCHDQLGDTSAAADALTAVMSAVPAVESPRAALYALARREIYRRDVVYAAARVDPADDPVGALVERVVRELRPHQREVLLLAVVCGLTIDELAWVLDVAADTADDLATGAEQRFRQALALSLASIGHRVPERVAEVYGALSVAPTRDVLARLPWRPPPALLRARILAAMGEQPLSSGPASRFRGGPPVKALWPTPPGWPRPLGSTDERTNAGLYELGPAPPQPGEVSRHEATTEPMPTLRPRPFMPVPVLSAPVPADVLDVPAPPVEPRPEPGLEPRPEPPADVLSPPSRSARPSEPVYLMPITTVIVEPVELNEPTRPTRLARTEQPADDADAAETTDVFDLPDLSAPPPAKAAPQPVAQAPLVPPPARELPRDEPKPPLPAPRPDVFETARATIVEPSKGLFALRIVDPARQAETGADLAEEADVEAPATSKGPPRSRRRSTIKPVKLGEHHFDWAWELIGFIICVAIALIVFFAVPTIVTW